MHAFCIWFFNHRMFAWKVDIFPSWFRCAVVPSLPVEEQHGGTDLEQGCGVQPEAIGAWLLDEGHGWWIIQCQQGIKSNIPKHAGLSLWLSLVLMWWVTFGKKNKMSIIIIIIIDFIKVKSNVSVFQNCGSCYEYFTWQGLVGRKIQI